MALVVAARVADRKVFLVAGPPLASWSNMLQRGVFQRHVLATHPTRHLAMQLNGNSTVNSNSGISKSAHGDTVRQALKYVKLAALTRHGCPHPSTLV